MISRCERFFRLLKRNAFQWLQKYTLSRWKSDNWNGVKLQSFQVLRQNLQLPLPFISYLRGLYDYTIKCSSYECIWIRCDVNEAVYADNIRTTVYSVMQQLYHVRSVRSRLTHLFQCFSILQQWLKDFTIFIFILERDRIGWLNM